MLLFIMSVASAAVTLLVPQVQIANMVFFLDHFTYHLKLADTLTVVLALLPLMGIWRHAYSRFVANVLVLILFVVFRKIKSWDPEANFHLVFFGNSLHGVLHVVLSLVGLGVFKLWDDRIRLIHAYLAYSGLYELCLLEHASFYILFSTMPVFIYVAVYRSQRMTSVVPLWKQVQDRRADCVHI
jgi:hypothetical protein